MGTERTDSSSLRHPLGAHDVGGRPGPTVVKDEHEHALWERRVDAMMLLLTHPSRKLLIPGLFNALSERGGAGAAVKDVFLLSEGNPV